MRESGRLCNSVGWMIHQVTRDSNLTDEVMEGDGNAAFRTDAWDEADSLIV